MISFNYRRVPAVSLAKAAFSMDGFMGSISQFGVSGGFGYELTGELNLLRKRDFPNTSNITSLLLSTAIDSLEQIYDYRFEPEMVLTFSPSVDVSERAMIYGGIVYSRNFRLDYDTAQLFTGLGYYFTNEASANAGISFGILNEPNWLFSAGLNLIL